MAVGRYGEAINGCPTMADNWTIERWGDEQPSTPPPTRAPLQITVRPQNAPPPTSQSPDTDWKIERWGGGDVSVGEDVLRSIPAGLIKGATGLAGLPAAGHDLLMQGGEAVFDYMAEKMGLPKEWVDYSKELSGKVNRALGHLSSPEASTTEGYRATTQTVANTLGEMVGGRVGQEIASTPGYKPQSRAGEYSETVAEFVPGTGRKVVSMALAPGLVSETVGGWLKGSPYEPVARAGSAIATGGLGALLTRPRTAQQTIREAMPQQGLPQQVIDNAERLIQDASQRGVRLTWAEAIEQVAPGQGAGLLGTQRLVENARDTRAQVAPMFAERPGQFATAARNEFDQLAPPNVSPSTIGPAVGQAAERTISDVTQAINRQTTPLYDAATRQTIPGNIYDLIRQDPVFVEGVRRVRADPIIGPTLRGQPDNSVAVVDAVKKQLDETGRNLRDPMSGTARNNYAASIIDDAKGGMVSAADIATGSRPGAGVMGSYESARALQTELRQRYLEPLLQGPLGKLASRDTTTQRAIEALFPTKPLANSEEEIATAVSALARRSPTAARQLVRAHVESAFAEASQNIQAGANQYGAASFAAVLAGNPQQRANLREAVRALGPNGDQVWQGFNRFLEIAEASGKRLRQGSPTAFTAADLKDLAAGRLPSEVAKTAAAPQRLLTALGEAADRWQTGRNLGELATILTDPRSGNLLRAIASRPRGGQELPLLAARLFGMGWVGYHHPPHGK
jgi:hypothetical protein